MAKATEEHTSESAPYEIEDLWLNAVARFPDTRPLADLLRTYSTPMPPGVRDLLAELLNPGKPDICGFQLVCRPTGGIDEAIEALKLAHSYHVETERLKKAGGRDPSQAAAETIGAENEMSDRSVYRRVRLLREITLRLRGTR
jgi:hypothetical protein